MPYKPVPKWPTTVKEQKRIARALAQYAVPRAGRGDSGRYREQLEVAGFTLICVGNTKLELIDDVIKRLMNGCPVS